MKKPLLVFGVVSVFVISACIARGERRFKFQNEETINRTLEFSSGNGTKTLELDMIRGSIRVIGYDGRNVEMTAVRRTGAASEEKLEAAKRDVKLDIADKSD